MTSRYVEAVRSSSGTAATPQSSGRQGSSTVGTSPNAARTRAAAAMPSMSTPPCSSPCHQRCRRAVPTRTTTARLTRTAGSQPYSRSTARVRAAPEPVPPHHRSRPRATKWPTMMPVRTANDQPTAPSGKSASPRWTVRYEPTASRSAAIATMTAPTGGVRPAKPRSRDTGAALSVGFIPSLSQPAVPMSSGGARTHGSMARPEGRARRAYVSTVGRERLPGAPLYRSCPNANRPPVTICY